MLYTLVPTTPWIATWLSTLELHNVDNKRNLELGTAMSKSNFIVNPSTNQITTYTLRSARRVSTLFAYAYGLNVFWKQMVWTSFVHSFVHTINKVIFGIVWFQEFIWEPKSLEDKQFMRKHWRATIDSDFIQFVTNMYILLRHIARNVIQVVKPKLLWERKHIVFELVEMRLRECYLWIVVLQRSDFLYMLYHLTGGNWQKWKRVFLSCPCHKSYMDEAVGLKSCKYTWKITKFVKMGNLGQYRENLIFCQ